MTGIAEKQQKHLLEIEAVRGSIYDRNMHPLAFNVSVHSLFVNPKAMTKENKLRVENELSTLLNMEPSFIKERLSRDKYFVWLKRKMPSEIVEKIKALKINGLKFRKESKRYYPNGSLGAHIIGFAGTDNDGLEGLELYYNKELKGKPGQVRILRDAKQRELMIESSFVPPLEGFHLVLTIDETIQYIAEKALESMFLKHKAKSGSVIVMDVKTGEILALANLPTYDLGDVEKSSPESRTNRAISYLYEPGSVFKIVTAAAALEEEKFDEKDIIFCENGKYKVSRNILTDHTPHGKLTFSEVFEVSSNIGVVKIAQELGSSIIYKYASRFRFGKMTGIGLRGEVAGWLKKPSIWSKTTIGAIPIGYEVTVTPLQLICALSSIANDGVFMKPFVVKYIKDNQDQIIQSFNPQVLDRVISVDTARRIKKILVQVVEKGTAKRAKIKGIKVAGKTGTARKVIDGKYAQGKYYATFMGFAPADDPRIAAIAVMDEPHPSYFGGTVSAPVVKEVLENSLKYLGSLE
ncbi:MAG: penicillin-binding protein 2 [Candidatus Omnitrophica bacterium]|nr:penicillin-binding protein 2 [Candidatus Omnitrophota bacterium]